MEQPKWESCLKKLKTELFPNGGMTVIATQLLSELVTFVGRKVVDFAKSVSTKKTLTSSDFFAVFRIFLMNDQEVFEGIKKVVFNHEELLNSSDDDGHSRTKRAHLCISIPKMKSLIISRTNKRLSASSSVILAAFVQKIIERIITIAFEMKEKSVALVTPKHIYMALRKMPEFGPLLEGFVVPVYFFANGSVKTTKQPKGFMLQAASVRNCTRKFLRDIQKSFPGTPQVKRAQKTSFNLIQAKIEHDVLSLINDSCIIRDVSKRIGLFLSDIKAVMKIKKISIPSTFRASSFSIPSIRRLCNKAGASRCSSEAIKYLVLYVSWVCFVTVFKALVICMSRKKHTLSVSHVRAALGFSGEHFGIGDVQLAALRTTIPKK